VREYFRLLQDGANAHRKRYRHHLPLMVLLMELGLTHSVEGLKGPLGIQFGRKKETDRTKIHVEILDGSC
jgi:hypothetical protein